MQGLGFAGSVPAFVDEAQGCGQPLGIGPGSGHPAGVRGDDGQVVLKILPDVRDHDGRAVEVVHRNIKETLDLAHVQVHGEDALGPGGAKQIRHQLGADGHPGRHLPVLAGVAEIGDDRGDAPGRGPFHRVDHDQQFHEVVIGRRAGGLDQKDVPAPDVLADLHPDLPVAEGGDQGLSGGQRELVANLLGQLRVGVARKYPDIVVNGGGIHPFWL